MSLSLFVIDVISGRRTGWAARLTRPVLTLLAAGFAVAIGLRRALYALRILRPRRSPIPVISVGNITSGGTGKTPLVEFLVRGLESRGRRPAVVSRGYGARTGTGLSDEALILRRSLPDVPLIVNSNRAEGCRDAAVIHRADTAVLDDGFQHLACLRDLDIVTLDATGPFGFGHLLPRGLLRERPQALRRAGLIVLTRADVPPKAEIAQLRRELARLAPGVGVVLAVHEPVELTAHPSGTRRPLEGLDELPIAAFCGLGNPHAFGLTLRRLGARVLYSRRFPDHHAYAIDEIEAVMRRAMMRRARMVIMTQKDAGKVPDMSDFPVPLYVLTIRLKLIEGEDLFWQTLERALDRTGSPDLAAVGAEGS